MIHISLTTKKVRKFFYFLIYYLRFLMGMFCSYPCLFLCWNSAFISVNLNELFLCRFKFSFNPIYGRVFFPILSLGYYMLKNKLVVLLERKCLLA